jgi:ABC-type branched-subunit amino acid transport system ATPase component/ABC-type branched-subunit amino acid transport system permease subunit
MTGLARHKSLIAATTFVLATVLYPLAFPDSYHLGIGIAAGAMAISTVGLVLLLGLAHQLAIGQAAFSILGGYANAILCVDYGWDPFVAMLVGVVISTLVAWAIATPLLKLRGFVLAMATLALHLMLIVLAIQIPFTGGPMGVTGVPKFSILGLKLTSDLSFYTFVWLLALLSVWVGLNIDRSRIGRALRAIAASETAASSVGIDITRHKAQMFVIGAGMASLSGSVLVHYLRATDPNVFSFAYSINLITGTIIGGLLSVWGGALGAAAIIGLREALRALSLPLWESVIMGGLTVLVLIVFPRGIAGFISRIYDRLAGDGVHARVTMTGPATVALPLLEAAPDGVILEVTNACRSFGALRAVDRVSFTARRGAITALIGPNGAGKTTLFNLICGSQPLLEGSIRFGGQEIGALEPRDIARLGIARTFQNLLLFDNMTVLENVMCGRHRLTGSAVLPIALRFPGLHRQEAEARDAARQALRFVGLQGAEALDPPALSFGHQRLVEIARALALQPRLLLMDEPASGLNDTETEMLSELILHIAALGITVVLVEHDMRLVMGLADHVVVMDHGEKMAEGSAEQVRNDPKVISAYLGEVTHDHAA